MNSSSGGSTYRDYSIRELQEACRRPSVLEHLQHTPRDYWEELQRRQQGRLARALNWWTFVIALATLANAGATVWSVRESCPRI
jgi:hypothetical protein